MKTLQPGSFDPIQNGHIAQAQRAIELHNSDVHIIGITQNPEKTSGNFHPRERKSFAQDAILDLPAELHKKIRIDFVTGLTADYCTEFGISYIHKGERNETDHYNEMTQKHYNENLNPSIITHVEKLSQDDPLTYVSSSSERIATIIGANRFTPHTTIKVKQALEARLADQYVVSMVGEISAGKSYQGQQFEKMGKKRMIPTTNIDIDALGHSILTHSPSYQLIRDHIAKEFGSDLFEENGNINRAKLSDIVFDYDHPEKLQKLNEIIKPAMRVEIRKALAGKRGLIIFNAALVADHDIGVISNYNAVNVITDTKVQLERFLGRENTPEKIQKRGYEFTGEDFEKRRSQQFSAAKKNDYFIHNQDKYRNGKIITLDNTHAVDSDTEKSFLETVDAVDHDLSLRFGALCARLGMTGDNKKLFNSIYHRYLANNHPYHNWDHIKDGIRKIHSLRDYMHEPDLVEMAYFFHDIIYQPGGVKRGNETISNELASALFAEEILKNSGLTGQQIGTIKQLILATTHEGKEPRQYTHDEKYMLDVDMSILGSEPDVYYRYAQSIRQEYSIYSDSAYALGRSDFLTKQNKKKIFYTPEFTHLEDTAHANMTAEISKLAE